MHVVNDPFSSGGINPFGTPSQRSRGLWDQDEGNESETKVRGRVGLLKRISGLCPAPAISKARYVHGALGLGTASFLVSWPTTIKTIPQNGHVNDIQYFSAPFDYLLIAGEQK